MTNKKKKILGGIVTLVGLQLSPFTIWNDVFVEIPICYLIATTASFFYRELFASSFIATYWLLNIGGCVLIDRGIRLMICQRQVRKINRKKILLRNIIVSSIATIIIAILYSIGIIRPIDNYIRIFTY